MNNELRAALERQNPWWFGDEFQKGLNREYFEKKIIKYINAKEILLILGAWRTGKSTLMYQIIHFLIEQGNSPEAIMMINLDEPLFQNNLSSPSFLSELIEYHKVQYSGHKKYYVFIDEVQYSTYFAGTAKTLYDTDESIKLILTGSTSSLIKSNKSLSGRYLDITIFPLSFKEFLEFRGAKKLRTREEQHYFEEYMKIGGFPRVVLENDDTLRHDILKNYFETIYLKDIVLLNNIHNPKDVFNFLYFLISNVGKTASYSSIARAVGISSDTENSYLEFAKDAYIIYDVMLYSPSLKKQLANPRKIYSLDTGLINHIAFAFSENRGRILENLIFIFLQRLGKKIYYHKNKYECDFIILEGNKITEAIQVCSNMNDETTRKREIRGLIEAMDDYGLSSGLIITEDMDEVIVQKDKKIIITSAFRFAAGFLI